MSHPPDEHFDGWAWGALEPLARHELEFHVATCELCAQRLLSAAQLAELTRQALVPAAEQRPSLRAGSRWAVVAAAAIMLGVALFFRPREPAPPGEQQPPSRSLSTAAGLQSLGRPIRYEELPDSAWLPDEAG